MAKQEERFINTYSQGKINTMEILVDKKTGINYLFVRAGYAGGLTVLLDENGKPVVTPLPQE